MGGDCLNTGCVPSKTLIASAHAMEHINTASSFGVNVGPSHLDYTTVHSRVHEIISEIAPHDSVERYRKLGIDVYEEYAEFIDGHTIRLLNHVISARRIVIATGSSPRVPTIDGVECAHVYTSDTIWERKTLPNNLVVIGAGPIGSELAMAYAQLGSTVHLVESSTRLLGILPKDQAEIVVAALKRRGVILHYNTSVSRISEHHVSIGYQEVKADAVLIATGREPNTAWLRDSNIKLDDNGYIKTDSSLRTSISSVYACGDVIGGYQFTHVAAYEASYAGSNALLDWSLLRRKPSYEAVPWVLYTSPEVAHVGINHTDITVDHTVTYVPLESVDRAKADNDRQGGIWLTADKKGRLVGATIIAEQAASLLGEATLAIRKKMSVNDVYGTIHAYPGYGDLYSRAAGKYRLSQTRSSAFVLLKRMNKWFL